MLKAQLWVTCRQHGILEWERWALTGGIHCGLCLGLTDCLQHPCHKIHDHVCEIRNGDKSVQMCFSIRCAHLQWDYMWDITKCHIKPGFANVTRASVACISAMLLLNMVYGCVSTQINAFFSPFFGKACPQSTAAVLQSRPSWLPVSCLKHAFHENVHVPDVWTDVFFCSNTDACD